MATDRQTPTATQLIDNYLLPCKESILRRRIRPTPKWADDAADNTLWCQTQRKRIFGNLVSQERKLRFCGKRFGRTCAIGISFMLIRAENVGRYWGMRYEVIRCVAGISSNWWIYFWINNFHKNMSTIMKGYARTVKPSNQHRMNSFRKIRKIVQLTLCRTLRHIPFGLFSICSVVFQRVMNLIPSLASFQWW